LHLAPIIAASTLKTEGVIWPPRSPRTEIIGEKRLAPDYESDHMIGEFHGPSYESSGGPWIPPELSMQEICFSQTGAAGPGRVRVEPARLRVDPRAVQPFSVFNVRVTM